MDRGKVPITIITGFLGAGKTTLINYVLTANHGKKIAVIENEFGKAIQIEGAMMVKDENHDQEWIELPNGCICCAVKDDLLLTVEKLVNRREGNLDYIFIEPSGLADPGALASIFWVDLDVETNVYLDGIITVVDAKHILKHLRDDDHEKSGNVSEAHRQIAFGDRIIINKTDLVTEEELKILKSRVARINSSAPMICVQRSHVDLEEILDIKAYDTVGSQNEFSSKGDTHQHEHCEEEHCTHDVHDPGVVSVFIEEERPLALDKFKIWLGELLWDQDEQNTSRSIFRCKGQVHIKDEAERWVLQGVHTLFELEPSGVVWKKEEKKESRLLFIGRGIEQTTLSQSFRDNCLS